MLESSEELRGVGKGNTCCMLNVCTHTHIPLNSIIMNEHASLLNVSLVLARGDKLTTLGKRLSRPERGSRLTVTGLNPSLSPPPAGGHHQEGEAWQLLKCLFRIHILWPAQLLASLQSPSPAGELITARL